MTIKLEPKQVHSLELTNPSNYNSNKVYLVNDGTSNYVVWLDGQLVNTIFFDDNFIERFVEDKNVEDKNVEDKNVELVVNKRAEEQLALLSSINDKLTELLDNTVASQTTSNPSVKEICGLLAVAQKPDLLKEL